jgi:hypothetical protein
MKERGEKKKNKKKKESRRETKIKKKARVGGKVEYTRGKVTIYLYELNLAQSGGIV